MALQNVGELSSVLDERPERLGKVFARHAYGMWAWVDIFSARIAAIDDPRGKTLVAGLVADNARHAMLFRAGAERHGIDPDAYVCPPEGEAIYDRIDDIHALEDLYGYALGSLDHFDILLGVYRTAAGADDAVTIDAVRADVARARAELRPLVDDRAGRLADEAHELYRLRELAETPLYCEAASPSASGRARYAHGD